MNILVYNIAADSGGALSILSDFYHAVCAYWDKSIHWHFIISTPRLLSTSNVHVHNYPYIKNGWHKRLEFDYKVAPKLVKEYEIDKIISLQNIPVQFTKVPQIVYFHQSLPFYDGKISLSTKNQRRYWIYKNVIGTKIKMSLNKADIVIVQSKWIRDICIQKKLVLPSKIKVITPTIPKGYYPLFDKEMSSFRTFFYPASAFFYKNHKVILRAGKILVDQGIRNFKFVFTMSKDDSTESKLIYDMAKRLQLPVHFTGHLDREHVMARYSSSVLIFPSLLETFGLPLAEATRCNSPIIAPDLPYATEVLKGYKNAVFFDPHDPGQLAELLKQTIQRKIQYFEDNDTKKIDNIDGMDKLIQEIVNL